MATRVDLDEIKNIPEDEFKQNLIEWVEQQDISKELQSKLRSDLIKNFGKTALGMDGLPIASPFGFLI